MPNKTDATPLVETVGLKKYFNTRHGLLHAVDGVNLTINKGETLGLVGESGCGKSTLGRLMINLLAPTGGQVLYNGEDILKFNRSRMKEMHKKLQFIFQDPYSSLDPRKSVRELIAEPLIINKIYKQSAERESRIKELMDTVGLAQRLRNTYPHELDGGRRQRIGIARALAVNPEFIICDEPVSSLDVSIQAQVLNLLMDLQDNMGLTYVFITHDLSVVKHISDEIAVMYLGQCVEKTSSTELYKNPRHPYTQALLSAIPTPRLQKGKKRVMLEGELTSPINPKPGCRFAARCPYRDDSRCLSDDISLEEISPGHFVKCPRVNEIPTGAGGSA